MNYANLDEAYDISKSPNARKKKSKRSKRDKKMRLRDLATKSPSEKADYLAQNQHSLCDEYAQNYYKALARSENELLEPFNLQSNDYINRHAEYGENDYSRELSGVKNKYLKNNRVKVSPFDNGAPEFDEVNPENFNNNEMGEMEDVEYFDNLYNNGNVSDFDEDGEELMNYQTEGGDSMNDAYKYYKEGDLENSRRGRKRINSRPNMNRVQNYRKQLWKSKNRDTDNNVEKKMIISGFENNNEKPEKLYMEFGLYLLSGIFLIFILEVFVNIGAKMRRNNVVLTQQVIPNSQLNTIQPLQPPIAPAQPLQPSLSQPSLSQPLQQNTYVDNSGKLLNNSDNNINDFTDNVSKNVGTFNVVDTNGNIVQVKGEKMN
jgi:hypothetical protein